MAGKLDAVDLSSDILLLAFASYDTASLVDVLEDVQSVSLTPFQASVGEGTLYDGDPESSGFVDDVRMFQHVGYLEPVGEERVRFRVTERGHVMADHLRSELSADQVDAIADAGVLVPGKNHGEVEG